MYICSHSIYWFKIQKNKNTCTRMTHRLFGCILKSHYPKYSNRLSELMHHWNGKRHKPAVLTGESLLNGKSKTAASWVLQAQISTDRTAITSSLFFLSTVGFYIVSFPLKWTILSDAGEAEPHCGKIIWFKRSCAVRKLASSSSSHLKKTLNKSY